MSQEAEQTGLSRWRSALLGSLASYIVINALLYFVIADSLSLAAALSLWSIKVFPLIPFLPALLKPNYKVAIAFCCLLLFYFTFVAFALFQQGVRAQFAFIESLALLVMFWSAFKLGKLH